MARLQSHVWVGAFIRAETAGDGYPAVIRKGSAEAGAIFVVHEHGNGTASIYGPVPQSDFSDRGDLRRFERVLDHAASAVAQAWLERQIRFDSDCWIIGTERREGVPALLGSED